MAIKAALANKYRAAFYKIKLETFTKEMKESIFNDLYKDIHKMHMELNWLKDKRKQKAKIEKLRHERGYYEKKRTKAAKHAAQSLRRASKTSA